MFDYSQSTISFALNILNYARYITYFTFFSGNIEITHPGTTNSPSQNSQFA